MRKEEVAYMGNEGVVEHLNDCKGEIDMPEDEKKKIRLRTSVDPSIKTLFAEGINLEVDNEVVVFNFIKTIPGEPEKTENGEYVQDATVVARVATTVSGFKRLFNLSDGILKKLEASDGSER